jgi:hypothetical protein
MKHKDQNVLTLIVGLLIVAILACGLFATVRVAMRGLASLDSDISVATIAAAATVFVSVLSIILGKVYESRALIQREHREKKIPVYEDLIEFMFRILMGTKTGSPPTEEEMMRFMSNFNQRIMVWGSDDVLAAWVNWRRVATRQEVGNASVQGVKIMFLYEELILTIRKDLGHKNKELGSGDILALFINDIDSLVGQENSQEKTMKPK